MGQSQSVGLFYFLAFACACVVIYLIYRPDNLRYYGTVVAEQLLARSSMIKDQKAPRFAFVPDKDETADQEMRESQARHGIAGPGKAGLGNNPLFLPNRRQPVLANRPPPPPVMPGEDPPPPAVSLGNDCMWAPGAPGRRMTDVWVPPGAVSRGVCTFLARVNGLTVPVLGSCDAYEAHCVAALNNMVVNSDRHNASPNGDFYYIKGVCQIQPETRAQCDGSEDFEARSPLGFWRNTGAAGLGVCWKDNTIGQIIKRTEAGGAWVCSAPQRSGTDWRAIEACAGFKYIPGFHNGSLPSIPPPI